MKVVEYTGQSITGLPNTDRIVAGCVAASKACDVLLNNGSVVAVVGAVESLPGVAHIWAVFGPESRKCPRKMAQCIRSLLEHLSNRTGCHRIQTLVNADSGVDAKWAEFLGFEAESVMRRGRPDGGDYLVYTWG